MKVYCKKQSFTYKKFDRYFYSGFRKEFNMASYYFDIEIGRYIVETFKNN